MAPVAQLGPDPTWYSAFEAKLGGWRKAGIPKPAVTERRRQAATKVYLTCPAHFGADDADGGHAVDDSNGIRTRKR